MNAIVRCLNLFLSFGECGRTRVRHRSSLDSFVSYRSYGYTIVKGEGCLCKGSVRLSVRSLRSLFIRDLFFLSCSVSTRKSRVCYDVDSPY